MIRFNPSQKYNAAQLRQIASDLKTDLTDQEAEIKRVEARHNDACCEKLPDAKARLKAIKEEQYLVGQQL